MGQSLTETLQIWREIETFGETTSISDLDVITPIQRLVCRMDTDLGQHQVHENTRNRLRQNRRHDGFVVRTVPMLGQTTLMHLASLGRLVDATGTSDMCHVV